MAVNLQGKLVKVLLRCITKYYHLIFLSILWRLSGLFFFGMVIGLIISEEEKTKWKEEMVMKLTILIIIIALGLLIPLYWIIASLTSAVYFWLHGMGATRKEQNVALNPRLGLTMADGGDPVDKKRKTVTRD